MTKLRNRLVLIFLALCLIACMGLVACGGDTSDNTSVTYTVTVKAGASAAASGVRVTIKKGGAIIGKPVTTDNNGKAEFKLAEDDYTVQLSNLPEGYELPADANLTFAPNHTLLIALTESFAYKVSLVTPDGQPYYAEGVTVGVCTLTGNCLQPEALGTDGKVRIVQPKSDYHVKVVGLPANAVVQCDEDGYAMYTDTNNNYTHILFTETENETKITVYPVTEIGSGAAMTTAEKTEFATTHKDYTADSQKLTAYKYSGTLAAGKSEYYAIVPKYSGEYLFFKDGKASYVYQDNEFSLGNTGNGVYGSLILKANTNKYIIHVSNTGSTEINYEFVVAYPAASLTQMSNTGTTSVVINDVSKAAVIEFTPKAGAAYKATVQGEQIAAIKIAEKSSTAQDTVFNAADYKAESNVSFKYTEDMAGKIVYLAIGVKSDAQVPVTLRVRLEKLNDLTNTTTQKQLTATLSPYADQEGTLTPIALTTAENERIVKDGDVYRYGVGGPIVVVSLTGILDERCAVYSNGANDREVRGQLAYLEMITNSRVAPYTFVAAYNADVEDKNGKTIEDYRVMLRGFTEYKAEANNQGGFTLSIPTIGLADNYYAKHVNADGVYPLNDELKEYLQKAVSEYPNLVSDTVPPEAAWLFACYYYAA